MEPGILLAAALWLVVSAEGVPDRPGISGYRSVAHYRSFELELGPHVQAVRWGKRRAGGTRDILVLYPWKVAFWTVTDVRTGPAGNGPAGNGPPAVGPPAVGPPAVGPAPIRPVDVVPAGIGRGPSETLDLPAEPGFVDFGDLDGDGRDDIVVANRTGILVETRESRFERVLRIPGAAVPIVTCPGTLIFDVDEDGSLDLIVPTRGGYQIVLRRGGRFEPGIFLQGEHEVTVETGGPGILDPLRSRVRIPRVELRDLNGDGRLDIVGRAGETSRFYLKKPTGFDAKPDYEIDPRLFLADAGTIARSTAHGARGGGGPGSGGVPGPGSGGGGRSGGGAGGRVRVHEVDLDADGIEDYLVGAGPYLRVYFGSRDGADLSRPHLLLKHSTEIQGAGSFDLDGDGRLDLVAVRFEVPALPRLIAAYFLSTSIEFDVLGYLNEGGRRFARRPGRRVTISLRIPPLREIVEDLEGFADRFLEAASRRRRFASGDLDGDGLPDAVFLDEDHALRAFRGRPGQPPVGERKLAQAVFDTGKTVWELQEILDFLASSSHRLAREAVSGRVADFDVPLGAGYDPATLEIHIVDLDADGRGDAIIRWSVERLKVLLSGGQEG